MHCIHCWRLRLKSGVWNSKSLAVATACSKPYFKHWMIESNSCGLQNIAFPFSVVVNRSAVNCGSWSASCIAGRVRVQCSSRMTMKSILCWNGCLLSRARVALLPHLYATHPDVMQKACRKYALPWSRKPETSWDLQFMKTLRKWRRSLFAVRESWPWLWFRLWKLWILFMFNIIIIFSAYDCGNRYKTLVIIFLFKILKETAYWA